MSEVRPDPRLGNAEWLDNWTLGFGPRFEIMEQATANVWLCQQPLSEEQGSALAIPDGFAKALSGDAVADAAYFSRSPDAVDDGPLATMDVDGVRFVFVARPMASEPLGVGSVLLTIDKHHTMLYRAGRTIPVLDFGDGTVAVPAWSASGAKAEAGELALAPSWSIREVELGSDLITVIPNPAKVAFLGDGRGFHGPLPVDVVDGCAVTGGARGRTK